MTAPVITLYAGGTPLRSDPTNFSAYFEQYLTYQVTLAPLYNAATTFVNDTAAQVALDVISTAASAASATSAANFKGAWSTLTGALNIPASVSHNSSTWLLISNTADVTAIEPSVSAQWQVITNSVSTVIPQTVSGLLSTGGVINQIRDAGAFTMPLANSVLINTILVVELPDLYTALAPTLTRTGADLFQNNAGTDTSITWAGAARLTLTSNGVDKWSL